MASETFFFPGHISRVKVVPVSGGYLYLQAREFSILVKGDEHDITYASEIADLPGSYVQTIIDNFSAEVHVVGLWNQEDDPFGRKLNLFPGQHVSLYVYPDRKQTAENFQFPRTVVLSNTVTGSIRGFVQYDFTVRSFGNFFPATYD